MVCREVVRAMVHRNNFAAVSRKFVGVCCVRPDGRDCLVYKQHRYLSLSTVAQRRVPGFSLLRSQLDVLAPVPLSLLSLVGQNLRFRHLRNSQVES